MKHLKTKLMASVAMLMVATVMISSASFAWFTLSTAPEVSGVSTNVATNGSLEIALANDGTGTGIDYTTPGDGAEGDTGKNTKWGNLVDISNYFTAIETTSSLKPVAYDSTDKVLQYPTFGEDGRLNVLTDLVEVPVAIGDGTAGKDGSIVALADAATDGNNWAYRVDYFLRTNTEGAISLQIAEGTDRGNGAEGSGCSVSTETANLDTDDIQVALTVYDLSATGAINTDTGAVDLSKANKLVEFLPLREEGESAVNFIDDELFDAEANTIYLVQQWVYWDGASATNESMATGGDVAINVQFKHETTLTPVIEGEAEEAEGGE